MAVLDGTLLNLNCYCRFFSIDGGSAPLSSTAFDERAQWCSTAKLFPSLDTFSSFFLLWIGSWFLWYVHVWIIEHARNGHWRWFILCFYGFSIFYLGLMWDYIFSLHLNEMDYFKNWMICFSQILTLYQSIPLLSLHLISLFLFNYYPSYFFYININIDILYF